MVFKGFLPKFQKNLGFFFWGIFQNSKKNLEFSKIPKFQKNYQLAQIFLEFWNTRGFFEFCRIPKRPRFLRFSTKMSKKPWVFQNSKNFKTRLIFPNIFGILAFWKTRGFFGIVRE